eukprot:5892649-Alexandrium_andersonii.AAC.1
MPMRKRACAPIRPLTNTPVPTCPFTRARGNHAHKLASTHTCASVCVVAGATGTYTCTGGHAGGSRNAIHQTA